MDGTSGRCGARSDQFAQGYNGALEHVDAVLTYYLGPNHAGRLAVKTLKHRLNNGGNLEAPTHREIEIAIAAMGATI